LNRRHAAVFFSFAILMRYTLVICPYNAFEPESLPIKVVKKSPASSSRRGIKEKD
jgi:hypothetical protein